MTEPSNTDSSTPPSEPVPNGEQSPEAEANRLRDLLNRIEEGLIETDPDGRVSWINASAARITGWPATEAVKQLADIVFNWAVDQEVDSPGNPLPKARTEGTAVNFDPPSAIKRRDGTRGLISGRVEPMGDSRENPGRHLIRFRDRTEEIRKRERETHCKRVLLAIREVGRLAMEETDARKLIERTCQSLTESLGYFNAWIALTDPAGKSVTETAHSGLSGEFEGLDGQLRGGNFPLCMRRALRRAGVAITRDALAECVDCPWAEDNAGRAGLSGPMIFRKRLYGVLSVAAPAEFAREPDARTAFLRLTDDVASALAAIEAQKERHLFSQMIHAIPESMSLISRDYRYLLVNRAYTDLLGLDRREITGQSIHDFFGRSFIDREIRPRMDRCLAGEAQDFEMEIPYPNKGPRWMRFSYTPYRERDGEISALVTHGVDVTDRKRAEEWTRESEDRYRRLVEGLPDLIFICDEEGTFLEYHVPSEDMLYLSPDRFMGRRIEAVLPKPLSDEIMAEIEQIRMGGSPSPSEYSLPVGGVVRHYERRIFPIGKNRIMFIIRDVTDRKSAEDRLRFQAHLLEAVQQSVVVTDPEGRVVYWNPFAEKMYGWSAREAVGLTTIELIGHTESIVRGEEIMAQLQAGESWSGEYLARRRDGSAFPVHANCAPIFDEAGNLTHIIGVSEDIGPRKEAERRRWESEERFRHIAATIPGVIYQFRLKTNGEFEFPFMSRGAGEIFGVSPEQAAADIAAVMEKVHPEDLPVLKTHLAVSAENLTPYNLVHRVIPRPGDVRWIKTASIPLLMDDGSIVWNGVAIDTTEQIQTEEKLQKSRERFRLAMEAIRDGLWDWDIPTDDIYTNRAYGAMLGYGPGEMPNKVGGIAELIHPEDRDGVVRVNFDCIENRRESFAAEFRMKARDGAWRWILGRGKAVARDETGGATRLVGTHTDITERKAAEAEKARLEAQFHQAQKMESIGRLAGGVAHDLNNLLSPILGYSEMLILETPEGDPNAGILEEIEKAAIRARDLVRQLLTFSRKQPLNFETLNLNRLLQNFEKLLRRTIREDITLEMRLARSPTIIRGDAGQLEQVVMNLAVNAQDAMPDGGLLVLETERVAERMDGTGATADEMEGEKPAAWVRLWARDTGFGMNPETRARLFEPFFTTKAVGKGTGLGLATVYGIIQQHGGTIQVESEIDAGAAFRVELPAAEGNPEPSPLQSRPHHPRDFRGRETILMAEDDPAVRALIHKILAHQGYTVIVATDGAGALAALDRHDGPVHLLLADVVMPDMNGCQLFRRVSELRPDTRVLYMSGYADEAIAQQGIIPKEVNFIQKPFAVRNLAAKIRKVLEGKGNE